MKLVLCEGLDDVAVVTQLCKASKLQGLRVEQIGGRNNLQSFLREMRKRPEFVRQEIEIIAILLDANSDPAATWQKLRNDVQSTFGSHLDAPVRPVGERPRVAGMLVSASNGRGMLEDLCLEAVSDQPGFACLKQYFTCLSRETGRKEYPAKARFRAWMAAQTEFDLRVGKAAEGGYLPWDHPAFGELKRFLSTI